MKMEMKEGKKFRIKNCDEDNSYLLDAYPGVRELLLQHIDRTKGIDAWREFETRVQYKGWTCNVNFHFKYIRGAFRVNHCRFTALCKAPDKDDQIELLV